MTEKMSWKKSPNGSAIKVQGNKISGKKGTVYVHWGLSWLKNSKTS